MQRSTVHFAKARWRGQLWMLLASSACQAVTRTQHADAITSACLYTSGQSELYVLFPHLTFSFFFFFFQSVAGIEGELVRRSSQISCCLYGFDRRLFTRPRRKPRRLSWLQTQKGKVAGILILSATSQMRPYHTSVFLQTNLLVFINNSLKLSTHTWCHVINADKR